MKLLHIINSLAMGGAEKLVAETLPRFKKKGLEVEVLLLNGKETPLFEELKGKNIKIHTLGSGSVYNPGHIFKIIPFLKHFDIVHVHLFPAQYFAAAAKMLSGAKTKLIFTEHNTTNRRIDSPAFKIPEKLVYAQYQKIIAITEEVRTALKNHIGLQDSKITVIENGIDTAKIYNAQPIKKAEIAEGISEEDVLMIQVSGFRPQKDQATAIRALQHLPEKVKLLLAGEGVTKEGSRQMAKDMGLQDRVMFLGIRNDIPKLLKSCDIVLLSSHYEGLSLASLEGMASGRPFIGSDVPGIHDLVHGYGILFPNGDEKALAGEIQKLMDEPQHYRTVAEKCMIRAKEFDISTLVDKTVNLYKSLVHNPQIIIN